MEDHIAMQDLDEMAKTLLETARTLPPGPVRHDILKEIGQFRARIEALRRKSTTRRSIKD